MKNIVTKETMQEMTLEERQQLINTVNELTQSELIKKVELLERNNVLTSKKIEAMENENKNYYKRTDSLEERLNNLRQPENRWLRTALMLKVQNRCKFFLGEKDSCAYTLFNHNIYKWCYASIAKELQIGSWLNISVKNHTQADSQYQRACDIAEGWYPARDKIEKWINVQISRRDNGYLPPHLCRALTDYLNSHSMDKSSLLLP